MESPLFAQHFWGEKHIGFDTLCQNSKLACRSTSDFVDFLRECYSVDDAYQKSLGKLAKQAGSYNTAGTFKPCWSVVRQLLERTSHLYLSVAQEHQSLMKDVQKFLEEQQKRQKSIKEGEASTQEVVHAFQVTTVQLQKAKEVYHSRCAEYQRMLRSESSSARDQEKLEAKVKKTQDEYKYSVEKYNNLRTQFVGKMQSSCAQFQEIEMAHLEQMREFLQRYGSVWITTRNGLDDLFNQFQQELAALTTEQLLQLFIKERGTGSAEPQDVSFEDAEVAAAFSAPNRSSGNSANCIAIRNAEPFFGSVETGDLRTSSALADVGVDFKGNGHISRSSLNNLSEDAASLASVSSGAPPTASSTIRAHSKRREGFFRRRRNSLSQDTGSADINQIGSTITTGPSVETGSTGLQSSTSLSAFNIVAKRGIRRLATPILNGKDRSGSKSELKASPDDWRTVTPAEAPKDDEGFSIRPSDPWADTLVDDLPESDTSSVESEIDVDVVGRTFKGIKVNIRPVGEFAPGVATLSTKDSTTSRQESGGLIALPSRSHVPVLCDRRLNKSGRSDTSSSRRRNVPIQLSSQTVDTGTTLIQRFPTAPALPPPPTASSGSTSLSRPSEPFAFSDAAFQGEFSTIHLKSSTMRPRLSALNTWGKNSVAHHTTGLPEPSAKTAGDFALDITSDAPLAEFDSPCVSPAQREPSPVRRCSSAVPSSMWPGGKEDTLHSSSKDSAQFAWLTFDPDSPQTSTHVHSETVGNTAWPTCSSPTRTISERTTPTSSDAPAVAKTVSTLGDHAPISTSSLPSSQMSILSIVPSSSAPGLPPLCVAAAFTETWRARFHNGGGSSFSTTAINTPPPIQAVSGELTLAFPPIVLKRLTTQNSVGLLVLRLSNVMRLKNIQLKLAGSSLDEHPMCVSTHNSNTSTSLPCDYVITIPGPVLAAHLAGTSVERSSHTTGSVCLSNASPTYVKVDVLTYGVDVAASSSYPSLTPPIHLCTYWRCERSATDFRLDYAAHWPWDEHRSTAPARGDLRINLNVDGDVTRMQSLPIGTWIPELRRATWRIPFTQESGSATSVSSTSGTVRAKFTLSHGPGRPQPVALQFFREECLASGVRLSLEGSDYRLSLCKRRIIGDRYICDPPNHSPRFQLHPPIPSAPTSSSSAVFHPTQSLSANASLCLLPTSEHN